MRKPKATKPANGVRAKTTPLPVRLNLNAPMEPHAIELAIAGGAASWTVRPLTHALMLAATIEAAREVVRLYAARQAVVEVGGRADDGLPSPEDVAGREGLYQQLLAQALARRAVVGWDARMADPQGRPIPFSAAVLAQAMRIPEVAEAFDRAYCGPLHLRGAEKNASRPLPGGTSDKGRTTAAAAATTNPSGLANTGAGATAAPTSTTTR